MAEQIANDATFKQITEQLQSQFGAMFQGQNAPGGAPGAPPTDPAAAAAAFDPSKYMQAMSGMFQNKEFMAMAEQLGKTIIEVGSPPLPPCPAPSCSCAFAPRLFRPASQSCCTLSCLLQKDPHMSEMMKTLQDPDYRTKVESALKGMKEDPELKPMLDELESAGPMAMMK